jgi:uncharacterized iron-regulated membrane protein
MTFRRAINRLHLWLSVLTALPLVVLCVTGALLVFEDELLRWEYRQQAPVTPSAEKRSLQECFEAAQRAHPDLRFGTIQLPKSSRDAVRFVSIPKRSAASFAERIAGGDATPLVVSVDPHTAAVLDRRPQGREWMTQVRALHISFFADEVGHWIVGVSTIVFLVILLSGIFLWFKRGGGWRRLLIKWDARGRRWHYDVHAGIGFYSTITLFLIGLSGVLIWVGVPWREGLLKATNSRWRERPTLSVAEQPPAGARFIPLDAALAIAATVSPETRATSISLPRTPKDPLSISTRFWWAQRLPLTVSLHPITGAVFDIDDPRQYESGHLIHRLNRGLHSGDIGTEVLRWLWFVSSLVPLLLIWTGLKLWWKPKHRLATHRAAAAPPAMTSVSSRR